MSKNDRQPPLLDELLKKWNNKHPYSIGWMVDREAFLAGTAVLYLARPRGGKRELSRKLRAYHAKLVLQGKAEAYQFWEDRRR